MTPDEVKKIIREELANILKIDRYVFDKNIQILNARNIQLGKGNGTMIGTEDTQKLGFLGATPVVRADAIAEPSGGTTVDGESRTAINAIRTALTNIGITK